MIEFVHHGNLQKTDNFLQRLKRITKMSMLDKYGERGVEALKMATPVDSGVTAESWYYEIDRTKGRVSLRFNNRNIVDGKYQIAIILQYGHATGNGGWVEGRDYINPAIQPIFDEIVEEAWKEVTRR